MQTVTPRNPCDVPRPSPAGDSRLLRHHLLSAREYKGTPTALWRQGGMLERQGHRNMRPSVSSASTRLPSLSNPKRGLSKLSRSKIVFSESR